MSAGRDGAVRILQKARPLLSVSKDDAKSRALGLYRAWYRQIPFIVQNNRLPKSVPQCRAKLRQEFEKHKDVTDIRVIDMLVIKGRMELQETVEKWKQECHMMHYWNDAIKPKKQKDFLSKFLSGKN